MESGTKDRQDRVGDRLIEGLREAVAIKRGKKAPRRHRQVLVTADVAEVPEPPEFSPERIRRIRNDLRVSQAVFADLLAVSASTVAAWEQGDRSPASSSRRLLELAESHPEALMRPLQHG